MRSDFLSIKLKKTNMYRGTILRLGSQICTMYHVIEAIVTRHLKECVSSISRHGRTKGGGGNCPLL